MTALVLSPFTADAAVELAAQTWRKKLLPIGSIDYKGRTLRFTRDYLSGLVDAFRSNAYDQVAFQLADSQNTHTNDPDRFRGEVADMELGPDGLYVTVRTTEEGAKVLEANPRLGVSARIVEDYARSDGKHFPAAIQHVLGTLDPRIPGLGGWQAIEAASPVPDQVIDLSASSFAGEESPPDASSPVPVPGVRQVRTDGDSSAEAASQASPEGQALPSKTGVYMPDLGNLTSEQQARLAKLLNLPEDTLDALAAGGMVLTPDELDALTGPGDDGDDGELSDAELDELIAAAEELDAAGLLDGEEAPDYEGEPVTAGLSAEAQFSIDLANARAEETQRELAVVTARLREEDFQAEKRRLADLGVPPYITELARPLLEGAGHAVELANGKTVDAGQVMRKVLSEYASQARLLDLDVELGSPMDEPEGARQEETVKAREDVVGRFKTMTGLK